MEGSHKEGPRKVGLVNGESSGTYMYRVQRKGSGHQLLFRITRDRRVTLINGDPFKRNQ